MSGGVDLKGVSSSDMQSIKVPGLLQERCWMLMANVAVITYSGRGVQEGQPLRV